MSSRFAYSTSTGHSNAHQWGWNAVDRTVQGALRTFHRPASFDEIAARLPEEVRLRDRVLLNSLRTVAECRDGLWQIPAADVVTLPSRAMPATTNKAAAA